MGMVTLVGLKTCDTCRTARKELEAAGRDVAFRDLRDAPANAEERALWLATFGDDLLNRRSTTWRSLDDTAREAGADALLRDHPALMKRPLILAGDSMHLGWTPRTRAALGLG